ncbi:MAG: DUF692 family protein [Leptospiraceae bacterium]|nr:DUF692 family protein [Leptospiraceae bacterium]
MPRFGIGWRREIADSILRNLDEFDVIEIIIDDYLDASRKELDYLKFLNSQVPVIFHGIQLGLASSLEVETSRLKKYKKVIDYTKITDWSEHLAFVRGREVEIHHLAQPPMNASTLVGLKKNLNKAKKIIGSLPKMENPASLIFPPGSDWNEIDWIQKILEETEIDLLLDLHNLYVNSENFQFDPYEYIFKINLQRINTIHIAGGILREKKLIDTHLHNVPDKVFQFLEFIGGKENKIKNVILERDGNFPHINELIQEIKKAKEHYHKARTFTKKRGDGNIPRATLH